MVWSILPAVYAYNDMGRIACLVAVVVLSACGSPAGPFSPTANVVQIMGVTNFTALNQTSQLAATLTLSTGATVAVSDKVTWASANPNIATVSSDGLLKTIDYGSTSITASFQVEGQTVVGKSAVMISMVPVSLSISELKLANVGETGQLVATATLEDGSSRDVTKLTVWSASTPQTAVIGANTGVVTALALGAAVFRATFTSAAKHVDSAKTVIITPPGTVAVAGVVFDILGSQLNSVRVVHLPSGVTVTSSRAFVDGYFTLGGLVGGTLSFSRDNYETTSINVSDLSGSPFRDASSSIQPVLRINAGESIDSTIGTTDMMYQMANEFCYPCEFVRVAASPTGKFHAQLTWPQTSTKLGLWIDGVRYEPMSTAGTIDVDVAPGNTEQKIYVGQFGRSNPIPMQFTLRTQIR